MTIFGLGDVVSDLQKIKNLMSSTFDWSTTPNGSAYWIGVNEAIEKLLVEARGHPPITVGTFEVVNTITVSPTIKTHVLFQGRSCCGTPTDEPRTWPKGHEQVCRMDYLLANCKECISFVKGQIAGGYYDGKS